MGKLSQNQEKLLDILERNKQNPLSIQELAYKLDLGSKSTVHHHLKQLEKKGYLKRNLSNPRQYELFTDSLNSINYLPFYGLAKCGPHGNPLDGRVKEHIPVSSKFIQCNPESAIILEAVGDSMETKIHEGDYVIVDKDNPVENGDIALLAKCEGEYVTEVLIKKIEIEELYITLCSLNSKYDKYKLPKEELNLIGSVKSIICTNHL